MLNNTLNTNEVKNAAGTEVEFGRLSVSDRSTEFSALAEVPNLPHRLVISHQELKPNSVDARRRSLVSIRKTVLGVSGVPRTHTANLTVDIPIGDIANVDDVKNVIAELLSFCSTTGAGTTVLFDCTGNGADALVKGGL